MSIIKAVYYNKGVKVGTVKFDDETQDPSKLDHKPTKWTTLEYNGEVIHNTRKKRAAKQLELPLEIDAPNDDSHGE